MHQTLLLRQDTTRHHNGGGGAGHEAAQTDPPRLERVGPSGHRDDDIGPTRSQSAEIHHGPIKECLPVRPEAFERAEWLQHGPMRNVADCPRTLPAQLVETAVMFSSWKRLKPEYEFPQPLAFTVIRS